MRTTAKRVTEVGYWKRNHTDLNRGKAFAAYSKINLIMANTMK